MSMHLIWQIIVYDKAFTESLVVIIMNVMVYIVTVVVIIASAVDIIVFVMAHPRLQNRLSSCMKWHVCNFVVVIVLAVVFIRYAVAIFV